MTAKYIRNDINTLKAIAIVAVVLFHFFELVLAQYGNNIQDYLTSVGGGNCFINQIVKLLLFRGGYIGVDIFLVVSGFLICTSILNSQALPNHQFSLIHFYKRRFYRLSLPLIPLIIFCAFLGYFVLAPNIFHELLSETARALTFISNQYFAKQGGYFALNSLDKILLHTWYLSLIGQFYIVFPLVVLLINKLLGQKYLKATIFALTVFTFVYAEQKFILSKDDNLYYLSTMRAWELLFGASLAFIKVNTKLKKQWFYIGITFLVFQILITDDQNYNPFAICFVALATALVIVANYQDSRLNNRVVQFVGKSSYSLYLWHWPIMVFCSRLMIFEATWFVVTLIIVTWLLSYCFERLDKKYFWVAATIYCLLGTSTFGVLALNKKGIVEIENFNSSVKDLRYWGKYHSRASIRENIIDSSKAIDTLMVGDSNLRHYLDFFVKKLNFKYIDLDGSLNYGPNVLAAYRISYNKEYSCLYSNFIKAMDSLKSTNSAKVIIANRWQLYDYDGYNQFSDSKLIVSPKHQNDVIGGILSDFELILTKFPKYKYYIISAGFDPSVSDLSPIVDSYYLGYIYTYIKKIREILGLKVKETFKPTKQAVVDIINARLIHFADIHENVYYIDRNMPICDNKNLCSLVIHGKPLFTDPHHLSIYGGELVGKYIIEKLNGDG